MVSQVRSQLDAKLRTSARPQPLTPAASLYPTKEEIKAMKAKKMAEEVKETTDALRAAGVRAVVSVEAEME